VPVFPASRLVQLEVLPLLEMKQRGRRLLLSRRLRAVADVVRASEQSVQGDVQFGHYRIQGADRGIRLARLEMGDEARGHAAPARQLTLAQARLDPFLPQSVADAPQVVTWVSHAASIDLHSPTVSSRTDRFWKKNRVMTTNV